MPLPRCLQKAPGFSLPTHCTDFCPALSERRHNLVK